MLPHGPDTVVAGQASVQPVGSKSLIVDGGDVVSLESLPVIIGPCNKEAACLMATDSVVSGRLSSMDQRMKSMVVTKEEVGASRLAASPGGATSVVAFMGSEGMENGVAEEIGLVDTGVGFPEEE